MNLDVRMVAMKPRTCWFTTIVNRRGDGNAINFTFKLRDSQYGKYIVGKGFIAIDGTSLTVTDVDHVSSLSFPF